MRASWMTEKVPSVQLFLDVFPWPLHGTGPVYLRAAWPSPSTFLDFSSFKWSCLLRNKVVFSSYPRCTHLVFLITAQHSPSF